MRNRSNIKIFVLFALILFLSVGYAVVSSVSLSITGTASAGTSELKVSFTGSKTISNTTKGSATVTAGSKTATFTASNLTLNESITYTYTVQNTETDVAAEVDLVVTGGNEYFSIEADNEINYTSSFFIDPNDTVDILVTVKMTKTPVNNTDSTANFSVSISASPVDPEDVELCCFDPGSKVLMADGTQKNIEDVKVGDMVMSLNEETGEYVAQRVQATIIKENSDDLVYVHLSNGLRIGMRAYHPLLTIDGWKSLRPEMAETVMDVGEVPMLKVGDVLVGIDGNPTIVSIVNRPDVSNYNTYNLTIENTHNYIVEGVVVHNYVCPDWD